MWEISKKQGKCKWDEPRQKLLMLYQIHASSKFSNVKLINSLTYLEWDENMYSFIKVAPYS